MSILITGASGKYGKDSIEFLLEKKVNPKSIVALVRNEAKGEEFKKLGVQVKLGDYDNYQSLLDAFKGVDKLLFISSNDVVKRLPQHENVVKAAKQNNIKHIIYTSFVRKNNNETSPVHFIESAHAATEILVKESGIPYTLLLNGLYTDLLTEFFFGPKVLEQGIFFPAGDGVTNYTTRRDEAEATVNILLDNSNKHLNKTYILANSEKSTMHDASAILTEIAGKTVPFTSPDEDTYKNVLSKFVPVEYIHFGVAFALAIKQSEFETTHTDLPELLGRTPTSLKQFLTSSYKK
ncbi:hypothetical protein DLAC_06544 [Tieghemostelium lacteum]|uniref:NmrA-like domain-containing protein n=1 Tax=Tieghemostelium lacteum TaxID=361077 RepID=A0A151ZF15_TIELA|nr:hypothetical protein DLAC_06544 [Tieghemostelium lacteum]|eukprot:KYQ92553.1 hypothetical protein DLAC_06544 [Tieghemostelium lacteum]